MLFQRENCIDGLCNVFKKQSFENANFNIAVEIILY